MRGYMLSLTIILELVTMEHLFFCRDCILRLSHTGVRWFRILMSRVEYANEFRV